MNFRKKAVIGMSLIFFFNILLIGGYYWFFLREQISGNLLDVQNKLDVATREAGELIRQNGLDDLDAALDTETFERFDFKVTNLDDKSVIYESHRYKGDLQFGAASVVEADGSLLLIEATRFFQLGAVRALSMVQHIIYFEIIVIGVMMVVMALVLQKGLIEPMLKLVQQMKDYGKGIKSKTLIKERQDELGELAKEFDRLTHALDEEKRMQEQIIASISHDIKTPLTSVLGYVERLSKGSVTEAGQKQKYLNTIYDRAQSINELVADFDAYLASKSRTIKKTPIKTEVFCDLLEEEYADELLSDGITLHVENLAQNAAFSGDLSQLRRVFGNLIGNAVKHAQPKETLAIDVVCQSNDDEIIFTFQDNGIDLEPYHLEHIFEPFHTGNSSRGNGSGLGLSICKSIVEAHDGTIHAELSRGGGLVIVFSLPI